MAEQEQTVSGFVKAKKYDWKDTNMALFGSDTEKNIKKESAETEPAWAGAGQEVGLKIWRIVNFEVKDWDQVKYGDFFNGDSYIILNTYKEEEEDLLKYDVHFWIGKNSTQDEYGTVAYKTVELDTFLDDAAVQHREVQGHESSLFKSYFPGGITTMEGGAASGFNHVEPETFIPKLLHFKCKNGKTTAREIDMFKSKINSNDVFILDKGKRFIQYNGADASVMEKAKAMEYMGNLKTVRCSDDDLVIDEGQNDSEFQDALTDGEVEDESDDEEDAEGDKTLFKLNEGKFEEVKTNDVTKDDFVSEDVFLLETPSDVFVWIGNDAPSEEKRNGISRAHLFLLDRQKFSKPLTVLKEGNKSCAFQVAISA